MNRYIRLNGAWKNGDKIDLLLPMHLRLQEWARNRNSVSIYYGPLGFSLKIKESYVQKDSKATAIGDSRWQETADATKWPSYEIYPASDWNYGLVLKTANDKMMNPDSQADTTRWKRPISLQRNAYP